MSVYGMCRSVKNCFALWHQGQVERVYRVTFFMPSPFQSSLTNSLPASSFVAYAVRPSSGAFKNLPVRTSKRQSWHGQTIEYPSNLPMNSGHAMCAHAPETA